MRKIWLELRRQLRRGEAGTLVTVVRTEGSAYQREGTKMLFLASGATIGTVSGGCVESDLYEHCRAAIDCDEPVLVTYSAGGMMDDVFGLGSGCQGAIELLLEPFSRWRTSAAETLLDEICQRTENRERFAVVTLFREGKRLAAPIERMVVSEDRRVADAFAPPSFRGAAFEAARRALGERDRRPSRYLELADRDRRVEILIDVTVPAETVIVFGAGDDARPLVTIAHEIGMEVTVFDWRKELVTSERFPDARRLVVARPEEFPGDVSLRGSPAVVLMSHNFLADRTVLSRIATVGAGLGYLSVLGPRSRTRRLLSELAADASKLPPIHTPAGLDLGADTPGEIALAIVAEILAAAKHRSGGPLSAVAEPTARSE